MPRIDVPLVHKLITTQFPEWSALPIKPVASGGWDNKTFHLGEQMLVRLPSAADYALQVAKEHTWLPKLAPLLPLPVATPLKMGKPAEGYPWYWSIYQWIPGETASLENITDLCKFAIQLAEFLAALQRIDAGSGPGAGPHNFYRGGPLATYDTEARTAITILRDEIDAALVTNLWDQALSTRWQKPPVFVHGDMASGNLLVKDGHLSAVIDFGCLGVGDPACDLVIAWTLLKGESREVFRKHLSLDKETWGRARGWALWKALITCAKSLGTNLLEAEKSRQVIDEVIADYLQEERPDSVTCTLCTSAMEWNIAKAYRQTYFFGKVPMDDPYLWTFDHKDHRHFALYHGANMVGYAHIQLWPENRAAIRIMVIEEGKRRRSFGKQFLQSIEEWLKHQNYQTLHAESSPEAYPFYTKHGYTPMPFNDPIGDECGPPDIAVGKML